MKTSLILRFAFFRFAPLLKSTYIGFETTYLMNIQKFNSYGHFKPVYAISEREPNVDNEDKAIWAAE